jgi:hypothetical protein
VKKKKSSHLKSHNVKLVVKRLSQIKGTLKSNKITLMAQPKRDGDETVKLEKSMSIKLLWQALFYIKMPTC